MTRHDFRTGSTFAACDAAGLAIDAAPLPDGTVYLRDGFGPLWREETEETVSATDPFYGYPLWMDHAGTDSDDFDDIDFGYEVWEDPRQEDDESGDWGDDPEFSEFWDYADYIAEEERREAAAEALEAPFAHLSMLEAVSPYNRPCREIIHGRAWRVDNAKRRGTFRPWRDRTGRTKAQCLAADESDRDAWNAWADNFCNHDFGGY